MIASRLDVLEVAFLTLALMYSLKCINFKCVDCINFAFSPSSALSNALADKDAVYTPMSNFSLVYQSCENPYRFAFAMWEILLPTVLLSCLHSFQSEILFLSSEIIYIISDGRK